MQWIKRNFGTGRGLVRLGVSWLELAIGRSGEMQPDRAAVTRLVFVCHGNICRSAFADVVARELGVETASFGLSTSSGKPAHPPVAAEALAMGHDMAAHRTTRVEDFVARPGDLLIAMETRHLRKLAAIPELAALPRVLLGRYAAPSVPHLHDPYMLDAAYLPVCLARIERAVRAMAPLFPGAKRSG